MSHVLGTQLLSDPRDSIAVVIAIDFGTAESGYAYAFTSNVPADGSVDVKFNKNWVLGQGFQSFKTRTCVLVDNEGKFCKFGYEAEDKYVELDDDEQEDYEFYDRFKMALHKEEVWGEETKITSRSGKETNALDIFTMSLNFFKNHVFDKTFSKHLLSTNTNMVRWVITVPAIWSVGAKQFMREAAYRAGLVTRKESERLVIALEPEAASLACRNLPLHRFTASTRGNNLPHGTDYLLLDCGGGTVDIIAHKVISDEKVKEIGRGLVKEIDAASGGPWGGVSVDDNFEKLLKEIFGADFIDNYKTTSPPNWLKFMRSFEILKRSISDNNIRLDIPTHFSWSYRSFNGKDFMGTSVDGVKYSKGVLTIKYDKVLSLFAPVVDKMVKHLKKMMSKPALKNVKYFFLVGGFSDSKILQDAIKKEFEGKYDNKIEILIPPEASVAVMEGAVRFGFNPTVITARIARKTYGFTINSEFDASQHDQSRKFESEGSTYCRNCFAVMIKKNQELKLGEEFNYNTVPGTSDATRIVYTILQTDKEAEDVKYADDKGVDKIGQLIITSTDTSKGKNRDIIVNFCIGDTELYVNVADKSVAGGGGDVQEKMLNLVYEQKC